MKKKGVLIAGGLTVAICALYKTWRSFKKDIKKEKKVTVDSLIKSLLKARYAVRGKILVQAHKINEQLKKENHGLPFKHITYCNIGNPQRLGQTPLSFIRNVLSLITSPQLLDHPKAKEIFMVDEIKRARKILEQTPGIFGGYTHTQGYDFIRKEIAKFVGKRDKNEEPSIDRIFMTDGASVAIQRVMSALVRGEKDGFMIPIPQYPLYSASIVLYGGTQVSYYLSEENDWSVTLEELERSYDEAVKKGINVRALVSINPGNPTGQVLSKETMKMIVKFCFEKGIVLLADEVYQENIYKEGIKWYSFRRIIYESGKDNWANQELVSFHSTSKGFLGECGRRGGYMEFSKGWRDDVIFQFYRQATLNLCPNVDGQVAVSLMVNPPTQGDPSYRKYYNEKNAILESLSRRGKKLTSAFNNVDGMTCNDAMGAMYAFPSINIPKRAVEEAKKEEIEPDLLYCLSLLKSTGICVVPGSGFCQKDGTHHFRSTFLPQEDVFDEVVEMFKKHHIQFMEQWGDVKEEVKEEEREEEERIKKVDSMIEEESGEEEVKIDE